MTFNVNYENAAEENFTLELTNDEGEILYQKVYNDKTFNKNIYVKNAGDKCKVNFRIRTAKDSIKQSFEINPQTKVIEEIVVTKL